jgi:hypothetical protein
MKRGTSLTLVGPRMRHVHLTAIYSILVQSIELDPSEVSFDGLYVDARGKVITIPDMFHQLHCLVTLPDPSLTAIVLMSAESSKDSTVRSEVRTEREH